MQELKPDFRVPNSSLRIGLIASDRVFHGLRYEARLSLLTPESYRAEIVCGELDFILVESCRESVTGHWSYAQTTHNQDHSELVKLIELAKQYDLPVVYWFTLDHAYHDQYSGFLQYFDYIFCADHVEVDRLQAQNITASTLFPAIQPKVHHPFKAYEENNAFEIQILYDGWADLLRFGESIPLGKLKLFDVNVIDSRSLIFEEKLDDLPQHRKMILGCVDQVSRFSLLRYTRTSISFGASLASPTLQTWMALETLACRVPQVHLGEIDDQDARKNLIVECTNIKDFQMQLAQIVEEPFHRDSLAQKSWRDVCQNHTFKSRLITICKEIDIRFAAPAQPLVTVICPSNRAARVPDAIKSYRAQRYTRKELIVVFNGALEYVERVKQDVLKAEDSSIRLIYQPMETYAGACLNSGIQAANGEYCFRMDDDDYYGSHFISDTMMSLKAVDADIFGKPPCPLYFEEEQQIYMRKTGTPQLSKLPSSKLGCMRLRLGGNTISGKTTILRKHRYMDESFSAADSSFLIEAAQHNLNVFSLAQSNVVASRRDDNSHTWKIDHIELKRKSILLAGISLSEYLEGRPMQPRKVEAPTEQNRPIILFLGPASYRQGVWQNRVKYIFPDLFVSLSEYADIHMLTGPIPEFAREGVAQLAREYNVVIHSIPNRGRNEKYTWWVSQGLQRGKEIQATIISNVFGGVLHGYAAVKIAQTLSIRSVIRVAGDEIESAISMGHFERKSVQYYSELRKAHIAFSHADAILVMSEREQRRVAKFCSDEEKINVCNRGVDLAKFSFVGADIERRAIAFLYVGRKSSEKGYDIIEAAAKKIQRLDPDIQFIFAGDFETGKIGNRDYLGFVSTEDLPALYDKADAFILCSRTEGMPQVVMEAMAKGMPCILSRHLFESQLEDREDALFTEIDADDLVEKIILLSNDSILTKKLGVKARKYAEAYFGNAGASLRYKSLMLGHELANKTALLG